MTYSVRTITTEAEFAALATAWNALATAAVDRCTFITHDWLYSWWTAYRPAARLRIVLIERDRELVGIAPMMVKREGGVERILRRLRFIGDGTSETDHMSFVVHADCRRDVMAQILGAIDTLDWDVAYFSQMPEQSSNTLQLLEHACRSGWIVDRLLVPCPRRTLPGLYEDLLKSLPSRLRTSIRSSRRDLEALHLVEFGRVQRREEIPDALEALYRNHASRWQSKGRAGVFVSENKRDFYRKLSARLFDAATLRLFFLKLDGVVVAQQYCFEFEGTVMLLQEGFDAGYAGNNVGNVLRAMVFEALIAEGATAYDFLAGASRHKLAWSDSIPNDIQLRAIRPTLAGRIVHALVSARRRLAQGRDLRDQSPDGGAN